MVQGRSAGALWAIAKHNRPVQHTGSVAMLCFALFEPLQNSELLPGSMFEKSRTGLNQKPGFAAGERPRVWFGRGPLWRRQDRFCACSQAFS
jgi:hypothetical protein